MAVMQRGHQLNHVLAAIDEALSDTGDEHFAHGAGEAFVEVKRSRLQSQLAPSCNHLALDGVAGFRVHCQTRSTKASTTHSCGGRGPLRQLALDYHLGGDAGVIGSGQPQGVIAQHAMPAAMTTSISVCSSMWPMGASRSRWGGITSEKTRPGGPAEA